MKFIADLHIHSHFSRATSPFLDPEHLYLRGKKKGITVLGTGDFTHPGWISEIKEKLEETREGLFRLKPEFKKPADGQEGTVQIFSKDEREAFPHTTLLTSDRELLIIRPTRSPCEPCWRLWKKTGSVKFPTGLSWRKNPKPSTSSRTGSSRTRILFTCTPALPESRGNYSPEARIQ